MDWIALALVGLFARPPIVAAPDEAGWRQHVGRIEAQARAHPDDANPALRLATGYARRRRLAEALEWAAEASRRQGNPMRIALARGDAYFFANQFQAAATHYLEVASGASANVYAHAQLWQCLRAVPSSQMSRALDVASVRDLLTEAGFFVPERFTWPVKPEEAKRLTAEGRSALQRGDHRGALAHFEGAITADGTHSEAFRGMALALKGVGEKRRSLGAWQLFLSLTPRDDRETRRVRRTLISEERKRGLSQRPTGKRR